MSECSVWGNMLQTFYVGRIRELNQQRDAVINGLKTRQDAEKYVAGVRSKIAAVFNLPENRAVPEVQSAGVLERSGFRVEKLIFYSRENFPVTASLYLPAAASAENKVPGVIFLCGHSEDGKACETYQYACHGLVLQGYAVLAIDPAGQGERHQFTDLTAQNGAHGIKRVCTHEHNMLGKQQQLCGEYFGAWRAYDAISGLNYLLSLPQIDTSRVGITGNSGGGTMTTFVQALDPRFTMAAPSCYVTSWQRNWENEVPADVEQIPPGILAAGCEMGDFILAYAPRPVLLMGQKNDFFDARGLKETYEKIRKVYALLGAEENIKCFIGSGSHGFSEENRCAMYGFFNAHTGIAGSNGEPAGIVPFTAAELRCTASGETADLEQTRRIHDFSVAKAGILAAARPEASKTRLQETFRKVLALPAEVDEPYYRVLRQTVDDFFSPQQRTFTRYAVESEPGIVTHLKLLNAEGFCHLPEAETVTLYIADLDASEEMSLLDAENGLFYGLDVRGIGESMPRNCRCDRNEIFFNPYGADYHYSSCALMFGSSLLAGKVLDVLAACKLLRSRGAKNIHLAARRLGTVAAAVAALLEVDNIASVSLYDAPESWESMVRSRVTVWPQSVMHPGILEYADLPDIYRILQEEGKLKYIDFVDQMLRHRI